MLSVSEDGVPPVHLLHNIWVYTVLLRGHIDAKFKIKIDFVCEFLILKCSLTVCFTFMSLMSCRVGVSMGVLLSITPCIAAVHLMASFSILV